MVLRRQLEQHRVVKERIEKEINAEPSRVDKFIRRMLKHPNPFIRAVVFVIHTVWIVIVAIVGGAAYIISMLAA
jgi:hypothetical protein